MLKRTKALLALDLLARSASYEYLMEGQVTPRSGIEALAATFRRFRKRIVEAAPDLDHEIVNRLAEGLMDEMQDMVERFATRPAEELGDDFWRLETASQRLSMALREVPATQLDRLREAFLGDIKTFARRFLEIEESGVPQDGHL